MWPSIVRKFLLPAHEALLRRPTSSIVRRLAEQAVVSDEHIQRYLAQHTAALIQYARAASPYWQEKSPWNGDTPPILTRADIARQREAMVCRPTRGKLIRDTSSGTTDDSLIFYLDRQRQAWDRALRIHALGRLGVDAGEKQLHFWPRYVGGSLGALKAAVRSCRDRLTNDPVFDLRPMSRERMDAALAFLENYRPAVIFGYPSWLFALAQHRLKSRSGGPMPLARYVVSTGEPLYEFQRRAIESAFGAPMVEEYGSGGVGLIASEDASGQWVVNWQHVFVEVLCNGRPAPPGNMGEIVVTNLHSQVMPFIRFATGDVVRMPSSAAPSARSLTILPRIEGRVSDMPVTTEGELRSNRELVEVLVRETGVTEFSLHQTAPDRLLCMTVRNGGWIGQEDKVTDLLQSFLGGSLQVEWKIGNRFRPLTSGKRRYICSPVAQARLAHDPESGMTLARGWARRVLDAD